MKMTQEHFLHMAQALEKFNTDYYRSRYAASGLTTRRFQWDAVRAAGLTPWLCDTLYKYLDDNHIQTALNRIISPI